MTWSKVARFSGVNIVSMVCAVLHGEHRQHRLAAEEVLVLDVVLVDLVVLVQVAVLTRRELELGDAEADDDR